MIGYIKYSLVGVIGAIINFSALWILTDRFHYWYLLSATIGIILGATNNFFLNYLWTFKDRKYQIRNRLIGWGKFLLSVGITEGIYLWLIFLFTDKMGWHYMFSAFVSLSLTSVIRYITANRWVWKGEVHRSLTKLEILEKNRQ